MPLFNPVVIDENLNNLEELEKSAFQSTTPQKFYSSKLTGHGNKTGLFNNRNNSVKTMPLFVSDWFTNNGAPYEYRWARNNEAFTPKQESVTGDFEIYTCPSTLHRMETHLLHLSEKK